MSSDKVDLARKLLALHPEWFEALGVYDETGKLPRLQTKVRVNFTIDEELYHKFKKFCQKEGLKMSQVVENLVLQWLKEKGELVAINSVGTSALDESKSKVKKMRKKT